MACHLNGLASYRTIAGVGLDLNQHANGRYSWIERRYAVKARASSRLKRNVGMSGWPLISPRATGLRSVQVNAAVELAEGGAALCATGPGLADGMTLGAHAFRQRKPSRSSAPGAFSSKESRHANSVVIAKPWPNLKSTFSSSTAASAWDERRLVVSFGRRSSHPPCGGTRMPEHAGHLCRSRQARGHDRTARKRSGCHCIRQAWDH